MAFKICIPRALLYYKYFTLWETFFTELGVEVETTSPTGKKILNRGLEVAENELCLPIKSFFGHVLSGIEGIDAMFVPRVVSVDPDGYTCPKLLGLPDMVENLIKDLRIPSQAKVISPTVNLKEKTGWQEVFEQLGNEIGAQTAQTRQAIKRAIKAQKEFHVRLEQGYLPTEIFAKKNKQSRDGTDLNIGIVGHSYLLYDKYLNMDIIGKVRERGAYVLTPEMVAWRKAKKGVDNLPKPLFWNYQKDIFGAVHALARAGAVDGIIYLPAFPCGPDSVIGAFIEREAKKYGVPVTPISMDEHAGEAGTETRVEAFIDMIRRQKRSKAKGLSQLPRSKKAPKSRNKPIARKDMIVSFPRMGNDTHEVLKYLFDQLGVESMPPPPTSEKTMRLGVEHAPETICLPLKLNMGNYIEVLEQGANTLIHAGGCGPCRFGFYGNLAESILREELDFDFQFRILEPPGAQGIQVFADFFRYFNPGRFAPAFLPVTKKVAQGFASYLERPWIELFGLTPHDYRLWKIIQATFEKKRAFDMVERQCLEARCYEIGRGDVTRAATTAREWISKAVTLDEIEEAKTEGLRLLAQVDQDRSKDVLRVGIVGEFFILLEPFINFNIEEWLGNRGIFIERGVYASDWIAPTKDNVVGGIHYDKLVDNAYPYLKHIVGGEGIATVGHTVLCAKHGYDGVIHMMPFTCMPETVAKQILPSISHEQNIPVLSLVIDEQTGKAGIETRLEAFVDLMKNRRQLVHGGRAQ
jgi:predicted nucleotide-binding protein (sugar kinase/HSP70/actin superfamily)